MYLTSHFQLAPNIYAARYDNSIIILDGQSNKYLSLINESAHYFQCILENTFKRHDDGIYFLDTELENNKYQEWILYFIEKKLIIPGLQPTKLSKPIKSGGLIEYRWDTKTSWKPFSQTSYAEIFKAFLMLSKVHKMMKKNGTIGLIHLIKNNAPNNPASTPTNEQIAQLSATVDAATILYPKKTYCLAWAATFVLLGLKRNWRCNLVIGVQTNPFYAHAWAECAQNVIHDDPMVAEVLSVIFKEPYS